MNVELRGHIWYATLLVPKDVREALGQTRFKKALGTSKRAEAIRRAAPLVTEWKAQIEAARGSVSVLATPALRWKRDIEHAPNEDAREAIEHHLTDEAERIAERHGLQAAQEFHAIATGSATLSTEHFERWKGQIDLIPKTKDQMVKDVGLLVAKFPTLQGITQATVSGWMDDLRDNGAGVSSQRRILSFCRNYWKFLRQRGVVAKGPTPFDDVIDHAPKKRRKDENLPYSPAQVVSIWQAAKERKFGHGSEAPQDTTLANLILLGVFSGARIEELCALKVERVKSKSFLIDDAKTEAGWREVPIHPAIAPLVANLKKESKDGYLISGLSFNKYKDRSNAIGKRYGRLKTSLGYSGKYTFHSFRSTVATMLENAGVPENISADIVGHEKNTMTYGLYSGGASLEVKSEALARINYPFPTGALP